jgi:hypothetical protein
MSMISCILFVATSDSCTLISIAFNCVYVIAYTFVDGCIFPSMMFSSFASIYVVYASTNYCSTTSFSSNSSMNTKPTYVALSHVSLLHANVFCFCVKSQLQMFQFYLYHELLFAQIVFSHYMLSFCTL